LHQAASTAHSNHSTTKLPRLARRAAGLAALLFFAACSGGNSELVHAPPPVCAHTPEPGDLEAMANLPRGLRINEVMTGNDGAWVDEAGETDDFIELVNTSDEKLGLAHFSIGDGVGKATQLPDVVLPPNGTALVWGDDTPEQGVWHMPFKLSNTGTPVLLWSETCELVDAVVVPELPRSESYARLPDGDGEFEVCRYATPERLNGESCEPPAPPNLQENVTFEPFDWPEPFPVIRGPLVLNELAFGAAGFVELLNASDEDVALEDFELRLANRRPGEPPPDQSAGIALAWSEPDASLAPGARLVVPVGEEEAAELSSPDREGTLTLFRAGDEEPSDRLDFMAWPEGAALSRLPDGSGAPHFCQEPSPDEANDDCTELEERELPGGRAHHLATAGDFDRLAAGGTAVGEAGVKFVIDMEAGDAVHLLGTRDWALHYTWIREQIEHLPHLDRCDPLQAQEFNLGWSLFSQKEYFQVEGRRYLLGTLVRHNNGTKTVEFTPGDAIIGEQMQRAFFSVMKAVPDPERWSIRPTEGRQVNELRAIEGRAPIVGPNAPYIGLTYQPLNPAVGFGTLVFVPAHELETAELGPNVIVVTDDVPNESAFMGGLITEAFQTPLAHVNVLAQGRNTPNMALRNARDDARLKDLFGKLVRLEVRSADFTLREATAAEADEYWQARMPTGPKLVPERDLSVQGVVALDDVTYDARHSVGSKAAGVAELYRVRAVGDYCANSVVPLYVPPHAIAVPFADYVAHFEASGAAELLADLEADPDFRADPRAHAEGLLELRELMLSHPVDEALLAEVTAAIDERFGASKVRFRSSSNTEDLETFNGAGLHTSTSADIDGSELPFDDALRTVWASLWNTRAYDERAFANIDQTQAAMGILIHQSWPSERAQGVAISRNALHATRDSQYYINAQIGEASVTNPSPGVTSDEIVYTRPPWRPKAEYQRHSSLSRGQDVLSFAEIQDLGCALESIHLHFQPLIDPDFEDRLFSMQIEWKLIGPERRLLVKQARPYSFRALDAPTDCREF
jgi:hypothetical protein